MKHKIEMPAEYRRSTLSSVFEVLGTLAILGGVLAFTQSAALACGLIITGILYFALAQLIAHTGATQYWAQRMTLNLETTIQIELASIRSRLDKAQSATASASSATNLPLPPGDNFYYAILDQVQGPVPASNIRDLLDAGEIQSTTPVMRVGEQQWRTAADYLSPVVAR